MIQRHSLKSYVGYQSFKHLFTYFFVVGDWSEIHNIFFIETNNLQWWQLLLQQAPLYVVN